MSACAETGSTERVELALETLRRRGSLRLRLWGLSMLPSLWPGDEVEFAACSPDELKQGHVVLALHEGRIFVHRVTGFCGSGVVTRGDAMSMPDPVFAAAAILGKAVYTVRGERRFPVSGRLPWWRRALGILCCYSSPARQMALRVHHWRMRASRVPEPETQTTSLPLSLK